VIGDPQMSFRQMGTLYYAGTNLVEAWVIIGASRSEEARSTCPEPRIPYEEYLFRFTEQASYPLTIVLCPCSYQVRSR
jgi:hypothetical protein